MQEAIWHDAEQAGYAADLPLYRMLAVGNSWVLELGAGTGRVTLDLAAYGSTVLGVDYDEGLVAELNRRADELGVRARAITADARFLDLQSQGEPMRFDLIIAPVCFLQIVGGVADRMLVLDNIARHLGPGGIAAIDTTDFEEALEDPVGGVVRIVRGSRTYVSQLVDTYRDTPDTVVSVWSRTIIARGLHGYRQALEPTRMTYHEFTREELDDEAAACGLKITAARRILAPPFHPSIVYLLGHA